MSQLTLHVLLATLSANAFLAASTLSLDVLPEHLLPSFRQIQPGGQVLLLKCHLLQGLAHLIE
jgi:hypothetical protein